MTTKENLLEFYYHFLTTIYWFAALSNNNFLISLMLQRYFLIYFKVKGVLPEDIYLKFEAHIDKHVDRIMEYAK